MAPGDARPGGNADMRQLRNQAGQLANDAQNLRRQLQQAGMNGKDLQPIDDVVKALRALDSEKLNADPRGVSELSATALDKMKKLEFDLRKRVDTTNDQLYLSGADDVPSSFKSLVEQYYRSLSKKGGGGKN